MHAHTANRTAGHACDDMCGWATGPAAGCRCACQGRNHGSYHPRAGWTAPRKADPFAGLPIDDDEAW